MEHRSGGDLGYKQKVVADRAGPLKAVHSLLPPGSYLSANGGGNSANNLRRQFATAIRRRLSELARGARRRRGSVSHHGQHGRRRDQRSRSVEVCLKPISAATIASIVAKSWRIDGDLDDINDGVVDSSGKSASRLQTDKADGLKSESISVRLVEKCNDGSRLFQLTRKNNNQLFGIHLRADSDGLFISRMLDDEHFAYHQEAVEMLHVNDRVLAIQGVPSRLLTPEDIQVLVRDSLIINIKVATLCVSYE